MVEGEVKENGGEGFNFDLLGMVWGVYVWGSMLRFILGVLRKLESFIKIEIRFSKLEMGFRDSIRFFYFLIYFSIWIFL